MISGGCGRGNDSACGHEGQEFQQKDTAKNFISVVSFVTKTARPFRPLMLGFLERRVGFVKIKGIAARVGRGAGDREECRLSGDDAQSRDELSFFPDR
jgi:hypothetical protein